MAAAINDVRRGEMDRFMSEILGIMKNPFPKCTSAQSCSVYSNIKKILEQFLQNSDNTSTVHKLQAFIAAIKVYCLVFIRHPSCYRHSRCVSDLLLRECEELLLQADVIEMAEVEVSRPTPHPTWIQFRQSLSEVNAHLNPAGSRTTYQPWVQRLVDLCDVPVLVDPSDAPIASEPINRDTAIRTLDVPREQ